MKQVKRLLLVLCLCIMCAGLSGCIIGLYPSGYGNVGFYGHCQYPATQFVAGPFGTYYRVDGVIVGNPIYEGRFIPTGPYCW